MFASFLIKKIYLILHFIFLYSATKLFLKGEQMENENLNSSQALETNSSNQNNSDLPSITEPSGQSSLKSNIPETFTQEPTIPQVQLGENLETPTSTDIQSETVAETTKTLEINKEAQSNVQNGTTTQTSESITSTEQRRRFRREKLLESFAEVKKAYEENLPITVHVYSRVRGGLRVFYKEAPLFLPASHFNLRRTPTDEELLEVVNKDIKVYVHEIQEYDEGSMAVIVSRKKVLEEEIWDKLKPQDIVEGKISSIATFGVFIDLGGVEGLIHVSRLAPYRIENLTEHFNLGDTLKAVVIEVDKERRRISLSRKELVPPTPPIPINKFAVDTIHNGVVRRLTDFGAFIELAPGIEGLLRLGEISWTRRIKRPHDVLKVGDKIQVKILNVNLEKRMISLSLKRVTENPWFTLYQKYPINSEYEGIVAQVVPQGCVITINSEVDGFLPRSKMRHLLRGNKIPFKSGDKVKVVIADIVPNEESLILGLVEDEPLVGNFNPQKKSNPTQKNFETKPLSQGISIMDILPEEQKENLLKTLSK